MSRTLRGPGSRFVGLGLVLIFGIALGYTAHLQSDGQPVKPAPPTGKAPEKAAPSGKAPEKGRARPAPARIERFERIETLSVGEFAIDLCRRDDGAFGLGEIRQGKTPLRRADSLIRWSVAGETPVFQGRAGTTISLRAPAATLTLTPETRESASARFTGLRLRFQAERGPIVETATWELGGSTRGLSYFDGYRGWHAPPEWLAADAVPETNPKLMPSLLHGTGFQFQHGPHGALLHFHATPGDRLRNVSRGEALEFETAFYGPTTIERFVFTTPAGEDERHRRINLWTRAYEVAHAELRASLGLPEPPREILLHWPPFSRKGFRDTAAECAAVTAREGFTGACIDTIWDNLEFHGGAKNLNTWDYTVCEGYGGEEGLRALVEECRKYQLLVIPWVPAGHLVIGSPVWQAHPEWVLKEERGEGPRPSGTPAPPARTPYVGVRKARAETTPPVSPPQLKERGEPFLNPSGGIWHGDLDTGFHDYFRDRVTRVIQEFGFAGLWLDTHLAYAGQPRHRPNSAKLAAIYRHFIQAGARHLMVEGDASAFGTYGIGIDESWGRIPEPDLFYGSTMQAGSMDPDFYLRHFRRYVAGGAAWVLDWDFLYSPKLTGNAVEAARREIRRVVRDYRRVKDRMVHRFLRADGSGYTWTNDRDGSKVVWLLKGAALPDGRRGEAGKVYVIEP